MTIAEIAPRIANGDVSPVDLVRDCLDRIQAGRQLNAFIAVLDETALTAARTAADDIARGNYRGPLHGIPVSVKDLIDMAGLPTTSGSAVPARRPTSDAPVIQRLHAAGAIVIGKTNLHEFALGTTGDETAFGAVRHPLQPDRAAGGSSSGAAVAIVEEMCFASLGTDTGGSIRIPSAACGIVGLKPSYGEVTCEGIVPLSPTCDHVGPLAKSVEDARILLEVLRGTPSKAARPGRPLAFGVPGGYLLELLDPEIREALGRVRDTLAGSGHRVDDVDVGLCELTPHVYLHIVLPEAARYHAPMLEAHADSYSPGVRLRLEMGRYVLAEDYVRAMRLRGKLQAEMDRAVSGFDALLLPSLPIAAPLIGQPTVQVDGRDEPVRAAMLRLTQLFNLTGHPAISIPAGVTRSGLPIGMQLVGARNRTDQLIAVAASVEAQITAGPGSVGGGTG